MSQITWKNVASTSPSGGGSLMAGAADSIKSSFDTLSNLLDDQREIQTNNAEAMKDNNTAAFLDTLAQYRTPEELEAAREQGVFRQMREQFGAAVDRDTVRVALDERAGTLRTRVKERQGYEDNQHNRDLRDEVQELRARALNGENVTQEALALGYRDTGEMMSATFGDYRSGMGERRAQAGEARAQRSEQRSIQAHRASMQAANERANERNRLRTIQQAGLDATRQWEAQRENAEVAKYTLAEEHNIPVDDEGNFLFEQADPADHAAYVGALEVAGLDQKGQETAFVQAQLDRLLQAENSPIQSVQEMQALEQMIESGIGLRSDLAPGDAAEVQREVEGVERRYEQEEKVIQDEYNYLKARNIFMEDVGLTSERFDEAASTLQNEELGAFLEGSNFRDMEEVLRTISMRGRERNGVKVDIPPSVAASIVRSSSGEWFGTREEFVDQLDDFIDDNFDMILEAAEATATTQARLGEIRTNKLRDAGAVRRQYLRDAGIMDANTADTYDTARYSLEKRLRQAEEEANR